jgi:hypothetical protein
MVLNVEELKKEMAWLNKWEGAEFITILIIGVLTVDADFQQRGAY